MVNKQHQCSLCEYKAVKKDNLQRHTNSIHKDQKFQCPLCEYKAAWKANLQRHIKSVHEGQNFQCPHCEYKATWKTDLNGRASERKSEGLGFNSWAWQTLFTIKWLFIAHRTSMES